MDKRVEQLEQTVQSLSGGQEGIAKRLEELFSQLNLRMEQLASPSSHGKGIDPDAQTPESRVRSIGSGATSSYAPKLIKLDFPRFDEQEDPTSWICRAERFFQFHRTPDDERVEIASFHLVGDAQMWYQVLIQENPVVTSSKRRSTLDTVLTSSQISLANCQNSSNWARLRHITLTLRSY